MSFSLFMTPLTITTTPIPPTTPFPSATLSLHARPFSNSKSQRLAVPFPLTWNCPLLKGGPPRRTHPSCFPKAAAAAAANDHPAKALRKILESPGIHQGPACFDALSAKLVERAGFQFTFMSGFSVSAARLGLPDVGLVSYGEMVDQGYQITQAVSIPVIGDGDNGYGNAMNIKRTVKGFIKAGFAGIILEDQVSPKACGHTRGRKVVSREEAVMRIKAAIDARKESGSDIVIIARTDSRQAVSLEESLWRSRAFADAGADVLFIDALASREEMKALCNVFPLLPKMANMLEGGGKTPIMNPIELEEVGFKIVSYPLSLIGVSIRAMEDALAAIKGGRVPPPGRLPSFEEIKDTLGFNDYYEEEKRYSIHAAPASAARASSNTYLPKSSSGDTSGQRMDSSREPVIEVLTPYGYENFNSDDSGNGKSGIWSRTLRLKITGRDGHEKLDVRIPNNCLLKLDTSSKLKLYPLCCCQPPKSISSSCSSSPNHYCNASHVAGFLEGMTNIIPGLGGVNIIEMLQERAKEVDSPERGKLLDFTSQMGDKIQVFVE